MSLIETAINTAANTVNDRLRVAASALLGLARPTQTAKQNFTAQKQGNDKGSMGFGIIHKQGDVTAGCLIQTPDGEHQFSLDIDGPRKGWTCSTSPGAFEVECGNWPEDKEAKTREARDSLILNAKNGNICIVACNGKIRLEATDIEMVTTGEGNTKGNVKVNANENIIMHAEKKFLVTATDLYKISTPGIGQICSSGVLETYGSIYRGVSASITKKKGCKTGGENINEDQSKAP